MLPADERRDRLQGEAESTWGGGGRLGEGEEGEGGVVVVGNGCHDPVSVLQCKGRGERRL